jgi:hypothetical protein
MNPVRRLIGDPESLWQREPKKTLTNHRFGRAELF